MGTTNLDGLELKGNLQVKGATKDEKGVTQNKRKSVKVALASAADTGGAVLAWQNPEAGAIAIDRIRLDVTTAATGAATIDVGATPTSATTSADNLIDGLDVNAATGLFDNLKNGGTNGKASQRLAAGKWITASRASGAVAGLAGYAYIDYLVL